MLFESQFLKIIKIFDLSSVYMEDKGFLVALHDLWNWLDLQELSSAFIHYKHSKDLFSTPGENLIQEIGAEKSIKIQTLSANEAWMLFTKIALIENRVPMDESKGFHWAKTLVAAATKDKISLDDWEISLSLMKTFDTSFPHTHPLADPELYQLLKWSYDALLHLNVENHCFFCDIFRGSDLMWTN